MGFSIALLVDLFLEWLVVSFVTISLLDSVNHHRTDGSRFDFEDISVDRRNSSCRSVTNLGLAGGCFGSFLRRRFLGGRRRSPSDLKVNNCYLQMLKEVISNDKIKQEHLEVLQNLKDVRNSLNSQRLPDALERCTQIHNSTTKRKEDEDDPAAKLSDELQEKLNSLLFDCFEDSKGTDNNETTHSQTDITMDALLGDDELQNCLGGKSFSLIRLPKLTSDTSEANNVILTDNTIHVQMPTDNDTVPHPPIYSEDLLEMTIKTHTRVTGQHPELSNLVATGTTENIIYWSDIVFKDDQDQKQAFRTLASEFILSYYRDATEKPTVPRTQTNSTPCKRRRLFLSKTNQITSLLKLRGLPNTKDNQALVMFLTGMGGSGKSFVISTLLIYAKRFCQEMKYPFTRRTIVVTALSGVAATAIGGETTHSALYLNNDSITDDHIKTFNQTRMVIVDEVSLGGACTDTTGCQQKPQHSKGKDLCSRTGT